MRILMLLLAVLTSVQACRLPLGPATLDVQVVTAETVIERPEQGAAGVEFRVTNRGAATVYLAMCGLRVMAAVDRREDGIWNPHSSDACQAHVDMSSLALEPGETVESSRGIVEKGEYRLRIGTVRDFGQEPVWTTLSNPFAVQ
jgi:hypothetical protein